MKKIKLLLVAMIMGFASSAQTWSAVSSGTYSGTIVSALETYGTDLYAGGFFTTIGGLTSNGIARWNGTSWSSVGSGVTGASSQVQCLAVYGGELYAGGSFYTMNGITAHYIAKYNGTSWSVVGSSTSLDGMVSALAVYNGDLYAGGNFLTVGGVASKGVAKWNGTTWSTVGTGVAGGSALIYSLAVYNFELYAGGNFLSCNGVTATNITKWNGTIWSSVSTGMAGPGGASGGTVRALEVYNTNLYAGGGFYLAGGMAAYYVAKWNGTGWSSVGTTGVNGTTPVFVYALAVSNSNLYVGGCFTTADGSSANYIAQWNDLNWSSLGTGMDNGVNPTKVFALADYGSELYAGGDFTTAGGILALDIAKWTSPTTNIALKANKSDLKIFPNPARNFLNIDGEFKLIKIYDYTGKLILTSKEKIISVSELSNGMYIIDIDSKLEKFIKN